jgi:hypothetical protein
MNSKPAPAPSCCFCGSSEHLAIHHIAKAENVESATIRLCRRDHWGLDNQLYRYGVLPLPGKPNVRRPEPSASARVLWAFGCGFHLTFAAWLNMVGARDLASESVSALTDLARLVATLDATGAWFGLSPADDLLSRSRSDKRRSGIKRQRSFSRPELQPRALRASSSRPWQIQRPSHCPIASATMSLPSY